MIFFFSLLNKLNILKLLLLYFSGSESSQCVPASLVHEAAESAAQHNNLITTDNRDCNQKQFFSVGKIKIGNEEKNVRKCSTSINYQEQESVNEEENGSTQKQ